MFRKLLIANRGEIAIRIARTAAERGISAVMLFAQDDAASAHVHFGTAAHALNGSGAAAYLDIGQIVAAARAHGCEALHPGYGFLSENAAFASACAEAGITFIGPAPETLALFGDKTRARPLAQENDVPVIEGTAGPVTLEQAREFLASLGPDAAIMLKAVAGGGGRGMRAVEDAGQLAQAYARCRSEAKRSFGHDEVYAERLIRHARHIEVQLAGDGAAVAHLWERGCTLQRQNQKLVEIAPAPGLPGQLRSQLLESACRLAKAACYRNIGTFEFLVDADRMGSESSFAFIEANPRLQVEHTVTEEVLGRDLVGIQLDLTAGRRLAEIGLTQPEIGRPRGFAIQLRINMEQMDASGLPRPSAGLIERFAPPGGPGVRVDSFAQSGYRTVSSFDSLLAKLIVSTPDGFDSAIARARRALKEFTIAGLSTNIAFLRTVLNRPEVAANKVTTRFIANHLYAASSMTFSPARKGGGVMRCRRNTAPFRRSDHGQGTARRIAHHRNRRTRGRADGSHDAGRHGRASHPYRPSRTGLDGPLATQVRCVRPQPPLDRHRLTPAGRWQTGIAAD